VYQEALVVRVVWTRLNDQPVPGVGRVQHVHLRGDLRVGDVAVRERGAVVDDVPVDVDRPAGDVAADLILALGQEGLDLVLDREALRLVEVLGAAQARRAVVVGGLLALDDRAGVQRVLVLHHAGASGERGQGHEQRSAKGRTTHQGLPRLRMESSVSVRSPTARGVPSRGAIPARWRVTVR
jgi:hypothetical protein